MSHRLLSFVGLGLALVLPLAADAAPTTFLPEAAPLEATTVSAGPGALVLGGDNPTPTAGLSLRQPLGERWAIQVVGTTVASRPTPEWFTAVGLRWRALTDRRWQLAPTLLVVDHQGPSRLDHRLTARLGLATEVAWTRAGLYGSFSLAGVALYPTAPSVERRLARLGVFENAITTELGLWYQLGGTTRARAGLLLTLFTFLLFSRADLKVIGP